MYCPNCGKANNNESALCVNCDSQLNGNIPSIKSEHKLEKDSFLAVSKEYQSKKKKTVTPLGFALIACVTMVAVFVFSYMLFWSSTILLTASLVLIGIAILIMVLMSMAAVRLEKYGNLLYAEYLKN